MLKKPRFILLLIVILTLSALYVDLPKVNIGGRDFSHPKINASFIKRDLEPKLGLDLAGGVQLTMSADMSKVETQDQNSALESKVLKKNANIEATAASSPEDFESSNLTGADLKRAQAAPSSDPQSPGY